MRPPRPLHLAILCLLLLPGPLAPAASPSAEAPRLAEDPDAVERLVALARLWSTVEYFHPWLAYREIDWEGALLEAIPRVRTAPDAAGLEAAVQGMLEVLGDPLTRVVPAAGRAASGSSEHEGGDAPLVRELPDGVVLLDLRDYARLQDWTTARQELASADLDDARGVVVDLRPLPGQEGIDGIASFVFGFAGVASRLIAEPAVGPGQRHRTHLGFPPWSGTTSGGYRSSFEVVDGSRVEAGGERDIPVAFLVGPEADLPAEALALQAAGRAAIVADGGFDDAALVSNHDVSLGAGLTARVRLGELVSADGTGGAAPDLLVQDGQEPLEAARAALARLQAGDLARAAGERLPAHGRPRTGKVDASEPYPSVAERLLAGIRIWAVIDLFFPYRDLMDADWDDVLRDALPRLEAAADARDYHLAVAEMYAHIDDTHGFVSSEVLSEVFGRAPSPLRVRWIEGRPVVTGFTNPEAAEVATEAGVRVGDVLVEVDGRDALDRARELIPTIAASTEQALMGRVAGRLTTGPEGSAVELVVDGGDGRRRVELTRSRSYFRGASQRRGEVLRLLSDDVGYADLDRLQPSQVPEMFERFRDTRAIVLDMRGYPNGTAWAIAPWLSEEPEVEAALFERPWLLGPGERDRQSYTFRQRIPPAGEGVVRYAGRTVMLIDERTISQAEHTGLFLEAANDTVFVGGPSNGANGDVTNFSVPGGIRLAFTGQSVRHADGRQLQRVGLQPEVMARPTIAGLRDGRDEVLEAALEYLAGTPG